MTFVHISAPAQRVCARLSPNAWRIQYVAIQQGERFADFDAAYAACVKRSSDPLMAALERLGAAIQQRRQPRRRTLQ